MLLVVLLLNAGSLFVRGGRRTLVHLRLMGLLLGLLMMLRNAVRIRSTHIVSLVRVRHHLLLVVPSCRPSVTHLANVLWLPSRETSREGHRCRPIKHIECLALADGNVHRIAVRHGTHQFKHLLLLAGLLLGHLRRRLVTHVHRHLLLLLLLTLATGTTLIAATVIAQIDKLRYFGALFRLPNVMSTSSSLLLMLLVRLTAVVGRVRVVAQQVTQMAMLLVLLLLLVLMLLLKAGRRLAVRRRQVAQIWMMLLLLLARRMGLLLLTVGTRKRVSI